LDDKTTEEPSFNDYEFNEIDIIGDLNSDEKGQLILPIINNNDYG